MTLEEVVKGQIKDGKFNRLIDYVLDYGDVVRSVKIDEFVRSIVVSDVRVSRKSESEYRKILSSLIKSECLYRIESQRRNWEMSNRALIQIKKRSGI